jgi:hypothetical protein
LADKPQSQGKFQGILPKDILRRGILPIPVWTLNLGIAYVIGAKGVS